MPFVRSLFTPRRAVGAGVAAVLIASSVTALAATTAGAPAVTVELPSVIPTWLHSAKVVGATPSDQTVYLLLALKGLDPAGEHAYGEAASTPGNPLYRQWLSKTQFQQRFGAVDGAASAVTTAIKALGATAVSTDALGLTVSATMPASLAAKVFGVRFEQVEHAGETLRVATTEPTLPTSLVSLVTGVDGADPASPAHRQRPRRSLGGRLGATGRHGDQHLHHHDAHRRPCPRVTSTRRRTVRRPSPPTYYGSAQATDKPTYPVRSGEVSTTKPYVTSGYTPPQIRGRLRPQQHQIHRTGPDRRGGAVLRRPPTSAATSRHSAPRSACRLSNYLDLTVPNQATSTGAGNLPVLSPAEAAGEQTLDVEAIHQMAPDASIDYSGATAPEDETIYPAIDTLIAAGVDAVNNSYGGIGDTDTMDAALFQTAVTDPAMTMGVGLDLLQRRRCR